MKKRILFVDDEPQILEGLRHRLRQQRSEWEMLFVDGGARAQEMLNAEPIDVIVSDMRMPQMDGATLLKWVQEHHPGVVRIVLSGHAEMDSTLRAVPVAHQFLTKPCEGEVIENVIKRACNLRSLIGDEVLRSTIGRIEALPPVPRVYSQLLEALADDRTAAADVARILEQDISLCAKLLQMVNSAFFRLGRTISRVEEAVAYLGTNAIKQVALAAEVFAASDGTPAAGGFSLEQMQRHSLLTAGIVAGMFREKKTRDEAFTAGLLHDVGKLVLATQLPALVEVVISLMSSEGLEMHVAERQMTGISHAEVGAYLLALWGLPYPIVEAVANHHDPERVDQRGFELVDAVHVADVLANEVLGPAVGGLHSNPAGLSPERVDRFGVSERIPEWRAMAAEQAAALSLAAHA